MKLSSASGLLSLLGSSLALPTVPPDSAVVVLQMHTASSQAPSYNITVPVPNVTHTANYTDTITVIPKEISHFYLRSSLPDLIWCAAVFDTVPATRFAPVFSQYFNSYIPAEVPQGALALHQAKVKFVCLPELPSGRALDNITTEHYANASMPEIAVQRTPPDGYDIGKHCPPQQGPIGSVQDCECYNTGLAWSRPEMLGDFIQQACFSISNMQFSPGGPDFSTRLPIVDGVTQVGTVNFGMFYRGGGQCDHYVRNGWSMGRDSCWNGYKVLMDGCPIENDATRGGWAVDACFVWIMDPDGPKG